MPFSHITKQNVKYPYLPNTVYLRSRCGCLSYVIKNWDPFVSAPLLAIDTMPLMLCYIRRTKSTFVLTKENIVEQVCSVGKAAGPRSLITFQRVRPSNENVHSLKEADQASALSFRNRWTEWNKPPLINLKIQVVKGCGITHSFYLLHTNWYKEESKPY